ncbi:MAG: hypothetical protein ACE5RP_08385 [Nitrosopumilus sp.]
MPGYLGNKSDNIVHHLAEMTPDCKIVEIKKLERIYFTPDTLDEAKKEKFTSCKHCIKS